MATRAPKKQYPTYRCECGERIRKPGLCGFCVEERTRCRLTNPVEESSMPESDKQANRLRVAVGKAGEINTQGRGGGRQGNGGKGALPPWKSKLFGVAA